MVKLYPFLIREHAFQPSTSYKKMITWEKHLFAELPEEEGNTLRRAKTIEIMRTDVEKIMEVVSLIKETRQKREENMKKSKQNVNYHSTFGGVLDEIKRLGEEREKRRQAELE